VIFLKKQNKTFEAQSKSKTTKGERINYKALNSIAVEMP
jgi:hypothetical protein